MSTPTHPGTLSRLATTIAVLALLAAACARAGTGEATSTTTSAAPPSTVVTSTTTSVTSTTAPRPTTSEATTPVAVGQPAPSALALPSRRGYHQLMAIGGDVGVMLVSGFNDEGDDAPSPDGAWVRTAGSDWRNLGLVGVPPIFDAAYDSESGVAFLLGLGMWVLDPVTGVLDDQPAEPPLDVFGARLAYEAGSDLLVVFGRKGETWTYDLDTDTWNRMEAGTEPPRRDWHSMVYDPDARKVIMFGGHDALGRHLGDTWLYDVETNRWAQVAVDEGPGARAYASMAYDAGAQRIILFGGVQGREERALGDTWAFDSKSGRWTELTLDDRPAARGWHDLAYDAGSGEIVLFGGGPSRQEYRSDTWILGPEGWSLAN